MKAMILSAGFGTRLYQYTENLPKALVEYRNVPMIKRQIERLKNIGVDEIVVNSHHFSDKLVEYFRNNTFGIDISLIIEDEILGTGGGILNTEDLFINENYFLVINVDVETDMDFERMIISHQSKNPFATLAVQKRNSVRKLEFDSEMKLTGRGTNRSERKNLYSFNGIHIISNRIFKKGFEIKFEDIISLYLEVIKDGKEFISGYDAGDCSFKDLGKIEDLLS